MHYPASLPLVALEGDTEFDYAAFSQGEFGESSSSASASAIDDAEVSGLPVPSTAMVKSKAKSKQRKVPTVVAKICQYQYLMHAILGLAASDLMRKDPSLVIPAIMHRVKAINAIKKSLANAPNSSTFEEGNALLATCFALIFQSVSLEDGMAEYMTFCRGLPIVAIQMYYKGSKFIFNNWIPDDQQALLKPLMEAIPPIRREWTDMAVASITALEPLCKHQLEVEYCQLLKEWAEMLYTNSFQGMQARLCTQLSRPEADMKLAYLLLSNHYRWWINIPQESFTYLINPENQVCLLLATHWIALKKIMATITDAENQVNPSSHPQDGDPDIGMARWLKYLNRQIDDEHREYYQWPVWVWTQLEQDIDFFRRP
ncbi:hypothetical protein DL767_001904 [Monosporascus sp. MG133]|nr:hypothetical protein DL767_001904 [Monosporascus sp. MG133]